MGLFEVQYFIEPRRVKRCSMRLTALGYVGVCGCVYMCVCAPSSARSRHAQLLNNTEVLPTTSSAQCECPKHP